MKTGNELQQYRKCIILFMVGIVCSALSYAVHVIDPIKLAFDYNIPVKPGSTIFQIWQKPPIDVFMKIYIFNVTNPEEFLNGEEKLKVQEIGPYVYQEFLENHNVTWNDNGTISFTPRRKVIYVPEMSVGDPEKDLVSVPNVPMLGVYSAVADAGFFVNYPLTQLANYLNSQVILNITVYDYLWGYEDPLVRLAGGIVPKFINFRKFGLLDRMYDEGDNVVNMNIKHNDNISEEIGRYLSIETYNYSPGLGIWGWEDEENNQTHPGNSVCNRIRGATEGIILPMHIQKDTIFRVFRKAFCRAYPIEYKSETTHEGLSVWRYSLTDDFLDPPDMNPDNECFCRKMKKCLRRGLSDLTPCYYNIPAAVSLPHFLDADPSFLEAVEGLHPVEEKHRTSILIQPDIGVPVRINSRLQTNLVMANTRYNAKVKPFNDLVIPLFWTEVDIPKLPDDLMFKLKFLLTIGPVSMTVLIVILAITGVTTFILSLIGALWVVNQQREEIANASNDRRDSVELRIPLGYGQYTAIRILPAIKKITSKTDLFG